MSTALETLGRGICPGCHSVQVEVKADYMSCRTCGAHGNPKLMRWCGRVPMFEKHDGSPGRQVYKDGDRYLQLAGYAQGCGRVMQGEWCDSCRTYMPQKVTSMEPDSRRRGTRSRDYAAGPDR